MVKETILYDILGLKPNASENDIKKSYKLMALKWHPDKNNHSQESTEKFQEIKRAYDVLYDPKQRAIYDKFGENGLNFNNPIISNDNEIKSSDLFSMKTNDLFSKFFGDNFFNTSFNNETFKQKQFKKGIDIKHKLIVTLEDLYKGKTTKLGLSRTILCPQCNAKGGKNIKKCLRCNGYGHIVYQKQMGPVIQRFESNCESCNGTGEYMNSKDRCSNCHGVKTVEERKILKLDILPGTKNGQQIIFQNEGDQGINIIPGDVVITIEEKKHDFFKRRGLDLFYKANINLLTALVGGIFNISHINGKNLIVKIIPGEIIKPNSYKVILGSGMPKDNKQDDYGDLIIRFNVIFPESNQLTNESFELLKKALPSNSSIKIPEDKSILKNLNDYDPYQYSKFKDYKKNIKRRRKSNDDDILIGDGIYDEFGSSENVQCTSQ